MLLPSPISASPTYERCGTLAPGPIWAFLVSTKVPHLSYVGDAEIGEGSNIGAGTVFANYDGAAKHRTTVGRFAKTGATKVLLAPVEIGDGAGTAGGTVVRRNVPPGALGVSGGPQRNLERWALSKRAGTPQADAAAAALEAVEEST